MMGDHRNAMRYEALERVPTEPYEEYGEEGAERRASPKGSPRDTSGSARGLPRRTARAFLWSQRGFTLIELIVYLAIVGLALTFSVGLAVALVQSDARGTVRSAVDTSAHRALAKVAEAAYAASGIDAGSSSFGADLGRLSLTMRDAARSPTVFGVSGGRLEITEGAGSAIALTAAAVDVTAFRLTRLNPAGAKEGFRVELTVRHVNPSNDPAYQFTQTYVTGLVLR